MTFRIFISYSTSDLITARSIESYLSQINNVEIYLFDSQLLFGKSAEIIIDKIKNSDLFVVLYSKNSSYSPFVQQEIGAAKAHNKLIIPILLDEFAKPDAMLTGINYLSIYNAEKRDQQMPALLRYVAEESNKKTQSQALLVLGGIGVLAYILSRK